MSVVNDDDDLTTDAVPSAPRADPENDSEINEVYIPKPKTGRRARTSKTKTKQIPNTAFANVINITNSNMVHIGPNIVINPKPTETGNTKPQFVVTKEIMTLFENKQRVNRDDLSFLARHIDDKWKDVGKALGLSNGELSAFEGDYKEDGVTEVIFKMLYDWMCRKTKAATIGVLSKVLWECEQQEAVTLWSEDILKR